MKKLLAAWARLWTTALLGAVYFAVLGPVCALARVLGWDPLALEPRAERSYWRAREADEDEGGERTY